MASSLLPNPSAFDAEPLTITTGEVSVSFNFKPLSGRRYYQILKEQPDTDTVSIQMMVEAIDTVYSSVESSAIPFTVDMAREIWGCDADPKNNVEASPGWEQWARTKITNTIVQRCTQGVDADPKAG